MKPEFTREEEATIAHHRREPNRYELIPDFLRLVGSIAFLILGLKTDEMILVCIGFGMLALAVLRNLLAALKYSPIYHGIFEKFCWSVHRYQSAIDDSERGGAGQPATALDSKPEGGGKPKEDSDEPSQ